METLVNLLEVNLVFSLCWFLHRAVFSHVRDHRAERAWWLVMPIIAFVLPAVHVPERVADPAYRWMPVLDIGGKVESAGATAGPALWDILLHVQVGGMLLFLVLAVVRYHRAFRRMSTGGHEARALFGLVVVPSEVQGTDRMALEAHERVHVQQGHSYDVLFYTLLRCISWWNPLWSLARRELQVAHELAADAVAARMHPGYDRLLVAYAMGLPSGHPILSFRSSNLRTRIIMVQLGKAPRRSALKYLLFVPVIALCALVVGPAGHLHAQVPAPPVPPPPPAVAPPVSAPDGPVLIGELSVQPEYPGGAEAMQAHFNAALTAPKDRLPAGTRATIYVGFVVEQDGSIGEVVLKRGIRPDLDGAVVEAVKRMPRWKPGELNGKKVATSLVLPVNYIAAVAPD